MLNTHIPATNRPYLFSDISIDVASVFNSLSSPIAKAALSNVSIAPPKLDETNLADSPEHHNILLARDIAQHRNELKTQLANIPLTALWLINTYGQKCYIDNDTLLDNDSINTDEYVIALADYYQVAQSSAQNDGLSSRAYLQAKQTLSEALRNFPFSAEQLKAISTTVTYAYYLNTTATQHKLTSQAALLKRMQKLVHIDQSKLVKELNQLGLNHSINPVVADFLLPPDNQLHTSLLHLISTEELWLSARQKLAQANTRLVLYLANQYKGGFSEFNDLVQEGQSGLLKAVDRFDHLRGFKFSTYAVYWIRQGISRSLTRNERVVRLPFGQMATISKVHRIKDAFYLKTGKEMPTKALAEQTGLSEAEIHTLLFISQTATSLDTPIGDDENTTTLADFLEQQVFDHPLNKIARHELSQAINEAINSLSEKEAHVICCRFGIHSTTEMTLEEIGNDLNLTRERVRQIQVSAIKKLKNHFGSTLINFL